MKNNKTQHILMANDVEWAKIKRLAAEQGMSASSYLVQCSLADSTSDETGGDTASGGPNDEMNLKDGDGLNNEQQRHLYDLVKYMENVQYHHSKTYDGQEYNHSQMLQLIYLTHERVYAHISKSDLARID